MLPYKNLLVYTTEIERVETIKLQTKTLIFGFIELNAYMKHNGSVHSLSGRETGHPEP
jgi:hypothetical protein